jgi:hypothetical protein
VLAPAGEERVGADEKGIGPLRNKRREDLIGITLRANLMDELFGSFAHRNQQSLLEELNRRAT